MASKITKKMSKIIATIIALKKYPKLKKCDYDRDYGCDYGLEIYSSTCTIYFKVMIAAIITVITALFHFWVLCAPTWRIGKKTRKNMKKDKNSRKLEKK